MDKEIIKLGDTEIKKHNFHRHKSPILIKNVDINKIIEKKVLIFYWLQRW